MAGAARVGGTEDGVDGSHCHGLYHCDAAEEKNHQEFFYEKSSIENHEHCRDGLEKDASAS